MTTFDETKATKVESTVEYWKPTNEGEAIVGTLMSSKTNEFGTTYYIDTEEGIKGTPSHTVLTGKLSQVPIGSTVKIVYDGEGEAKKGQSAAKLYTVAYIPA